MAPGASTSAVPLSADLVRRLHRRAGAGRWALSEADFGAALGRSAAHRYRDEAPEASEVERYLESLRLDDLALACACARGSEPAWEHFVREFRPALLAAARSAAPPDLARELTDTLYADLFGLDERDGVRRSLFDYFHGRSTLVGWLRAVLAQRVVDRVRAERRMEPLADAQADRRPAAGTEAPDVDRPRYVGLVQAALTAALAGLHSRDRLRLACYYTDQMTLAATGRLLGESEATVSRKLERTRRDLRQAIERILREREGLNDGEVETCFEYGRSDTGLDLSRVLPGTAGHRGTAAGIEPAPPGTCKIEMLDRSS